MALEEKTLKDRRCDINRKKDRMAITQEKELEFLKMRITDELEAVMINRVKEFDA